MIATWMRLHRVRRRFGLAGPGLALALLAGACASTQEPPTHFGPWGPIAPVKEPALSVLAAAIGALAAESPRSVVVARYAGDVYQRLDLDALRTRVRVAMDVDGKLGPIDRGNPKYRARVFEADFQGKTTILEVSVPRIRGASATLTAWRWDGLAWNCELRGKAEHVTLRLEGGQWKVAAVSAEPGVVVLKTDCP